MRGRTIYTIGHSNRSLEEFIALLKARGVSQVADVRTVPRSRHNPHFSGEALVHSLPDAGIGYRRFDDLGGFRHTKKDSVNLGWRNLSFRGYADYMGTPSFAEGLAKLESFATEAPTAIMCAEAVPWRCHRSLIADALALRKWVVLDITSAAKPVPHRMTPFLKVEKGMLTYPLDQNSLGV